MIFITARFEIKPEHADDWANIAGPYTAACRAEDGCLWFDWARDLDDPNVYVLLEAFRDDDAAGDHVQSDHFATACATLPAYLQATPKIVNVNVDGWSELGELAVTD